MDAEPKVFLTLNLPERGLAGRPLVASQNIALLRVFKSFILHDWEAKLRDAPTEEDLIVYRCELTRLRSLLDIFIPTGDKDKEKEAR